MALAVEAASEVPRVLKEPASMCNLMAFGPSALELELRIWIDDPQNGVSNVKSEVYLTLLEKLRAAGIEIPCEQRDLHVREPVSVQILDWLGSNPEVRRAASG
jgi:small-conductance mechanosensitive channel